MGAGAALVAAAELKGRVAAVVSRGGRPDLAMDFLPQVTSPTSLVVGSLDHDVIALNEQALAALTCSKKLAIVLGAGHLFEEPGTLDIAVDHAANWFKTHLIEPATSRPKPAALPRTDTARSVLRAAAEPLPPIQILPCEVFNQVGFAGPGLTDHIGMEQPIRQGLPKCIRFVSVIGRAQGHLGDGIFGSHALSMPNPSPSARPARVTPRNTRGPGSRCTQPV